MLPPTIAKGKEGKARLRGSTRDPYREGVVLVREVESSFRIHQCEADRTGEVES